MKLNENPFAVLNASPQDDRSRLIEKGDEAALLGGTEVDDALYQLTQMNSRLTAELSWLPGTNLKTVEAFIAYEKNASAGMSLPSLEKLGCPLAQANALAAFFEKWPGTKIPYAIGVCRSLDKILEQVTAAETRAVINQDRKAGNWPLIANDAAIASQLEEKLHELARIAASRLERINQENDFRQAVKLLFEYTDFDPQGVVGKTVLDSYLIHISEEKEKITRRIQKQTADDQRKKISLINVKALMEDVERWCELTAPLRRSPGAIRREGEEICRNTRDCLIEYFNNAPTIEKKLSKTVPSKEGPKTITLTYQSRSENVRVTTEYSKRLIELFPECATQVLQLKKDISTLADIMVDEESQMREKLIKAK